LKLPQSERHEIMRQQKLFFNCLKIFAILSFFSSGSVWAWCDNPKTIGTFFRLNTDIGAGYLSPDQVPDSIDLLPPPPAEGSAAFALDQKVSKEILALRGTPRWRMAAGDAVLTFPHAAETFSCALNVPITMQMTPRLCTLLSRTAMDAAQSTHAAKQKYDRARPFTVNKEPTCTPQGEISLKSNGSYPSGHTAIGWAWALLLSEIAPDRKDTLLARGQAFGESRVICNVHWKSDVSAGRYMGAATIERLKKNAAFCADMVAAKAELKMVRAKGLKPSRDCRAECKALSSQSALF
jgi:acid phosphatase (class A)